MNLEEACCSDRSDRLGIVFTELDTMDIAFQQCFEWANPPFKVHWIRKEKLVRLPRNVSAYVTHPSTLAAIQIHSNQEVLQKAFEVANNEDSEMRKVVVECPSSCMHGPSSFAACLARMKAWSEQATSGDDNSRTGSFRFVLFLLPEDLQTAEYLQIISLYSLNIFNLSSELSLRSLVSPLFHTLSSQEVKTEMTSQ